MERSDAVDALFDALAKARKQFRVVRRNSTNPYFQHPYAELDEYIEATKDGLSDNGLAVVQLPVYNPEESGVTIATMVGHASGQWMLDRLWIPVTKGDAQGIGSAITYGRRYHYGAMLNVAASGEDDDANAAVGTSQKDRGAKTTDKDVGKGKTINPAQQRALWSAFKKGGKTEDEFRIRLSAKYGIEHTQDILKTDLDDILKWLLGTSEPEPQPEREPGSDDELASPELDFTHEHPYGGQKK